MNMTLSKRGDYVMRSAISLARAHQVGAARKVREVVAETAVPQSFASQILADLVRSGLASSKAGRDGGYRLRRSPTEISVLEVIEAAEGPLRADRCALGEGPCRWEQVCPLHQTWAAATVALRDLLAGTSLSELADRDAALEEGSYQVPADAHRSHPVTVDVSDVVQVELGAPDARSALVKVTARLPRLVAAASGSGATPAPTATTDVTGKPGRGRTQRPAASLTPAGPLNSAPGGDERYLLAWRLAGNPASHFEAELSISPVDAERCELSVQGTWRQNPGSGPPTVRSELEEQARRTLRAFLLRLARALEESQVQLPTPARAPFT